MAELETFLDVGQVAEVLGLSIATIRKWVLIRYIPYQKLGRAVRFSASEIRERVKTRTVKPAAGQKCLAEQPGMKEETHDTDNNREQRRRNIPYR
ncbi:MAG: helix-turn-helix domain-containing protein [Treponema sp.]|jgi:excisionase family DNA binding protein|nr:helix-turn-helix domain-containing protein [Treponema sp.]